MVVALFVSVLFFTPILKKLYSKGPIRLLTIITNLVFIIIVVTFWDIIIKFFYLSTYFELITIYCVVLMIVM